MQYSLSQVKAVLIVLYTLQGLPIGIIEAFSLILQMNGASYSQLGLFKFAFWPFSLKLLWAPIVDTLRLSAFNVGKRKTWLVPTQIGIGAIFLYLSGCVDEILSTASEEATILRFTCLMTLAMFFAATQDIAVDGWALSLLPRDHLDLASTCNNSGQSLGFLIGFFSFILLEVSTFGFLFRVFGTVFFCFTVCIALFVREQTDITTNSTATGQYGEILDSYRNIFQFLKLPSVRKLALHLLINRVTFCAAETVSGNKLIEYHMSKDVLSVMVVPVMLVQLLLPVLFTGTLRRLGAIKFFLVLYVPRMLLCFSAIFVFGYVTSESAFTDKLNLGFNMFFENYFSNEKLGNFTFKPYFFVFLYDLVCLVPGYLMTMSLMSFFAEISDPMYGGAQMTLLNTLHNLSVKWPQTCCLLLVDVLTLNGCLKLSNMRILTDHKVEDGGLKRLFFFSFFERVYRHFFGDCTDNSTSEVYRHVDGYEVLLVACLLLGVLYVVFFFRDFLSLGKYSGDDWSVNSLNKNKNKKKEKQKEIKAD